MISVLEPFMKYEVGQIIYLLLNNEMKIFPVRVAEEIIRRRLGSEDVTYKVILPTKSRELVDLSDLDATIFTSTDALRNHMVENAVKTINTLIERSNRVAASLTQQREEPPQEPVREDEE
jgi:hypothetical protein